MRMLTSLLPLSSMPPHDTAPSCVFQAGKILIHSQATAKAALCSRLSIAVTHLQGHIWLDEVVACVQRGCKALLLFVVYKEVQQLAGNLHVPTLGRRLHRVLQGAQSRWAFHEHRNTTVLCRSSSSTWAPCGRLLHQEPGKAKRVLHGALSVLGALLQQTLAMLSRVSVTPLSRTSLVPLSDSSQYWQDPCVCFCKYIKDAGANKTSLTLYSLSCLARATALRQRSAFL